MPVVTALLVVTVGWPDPQRAMDGFAHAGIPSAGAFATIACLCWTVTAVLAFGVCMGRLRRARGRRIPSARHAWPGAILAIGLALLTLGFMHHQLGYRVCCADAATAQQAEQLAR